MAHETPNSLYTLPSLVLDLRQVDFGYMVVLSAIESFDHINRLMDEEDVQQIADLVGDFVENVSSGLLTLELIDKRSWTARVVPKPRFGSIDPEEIAEEMHDIEQILLGSP